MKASKSELRKLEAKEKMSAAIHEASHAALASKFGCYAAASIWRNPSNDPEQKTWLGRCEIYGQPGAVRMPDELKKQLGVVTAPANWQTIVGLAGLVGERIFEGNSCVESIFQEIESELMYGDEISETDLHMIGDAIRFDDVALVVDLLTTLRAEITSRAKELMMFA